ncbi:MAG: cbb3-type cytochrome c oxidase subunit I, partial [Chloroflexi bacterium]|nr:cbb3-type cytochrome c oxidase subunit I [Chloroflexota bacterium]
MTLWQEIKVQSEDRKLLIAFISSGLVIMTIGLIFALVMLLVRTPAISILPSNIYYQALTGHSLMMFIFWLSFVQSAFLIVTCTVLIQRRLRSYRLAWAGWGVMVAAALCALTAVLLGANVSYHALFPLSRQFPAAWLIYLSAVVLTLGMSLIVVDFVATILSSVERKRSLTSWIAFLKRIPTSTFAAIAGLFIAVPGLIASFKVFVPAFLLSLGTAPIDPMVSNLYRMNWHIAFHIYH